MRAIPTKDDITPDGGSGFVGDGGTGCIDLHGSLGDSGDKVIKPVNPGDGGTQI